MLVKTRKYKLETGKYIKIALEGVLRQQWWVGLIVLGIMANGVGTDAMDKSVKDACTWVNIE